MLTPSSTRTVGMALASVRPGKVRPDDVEGLLAGGQLRGHAITDVLADQRAGQGRHDRDAAPGRLSLVGADDLVANLLAALVLEEHRRGERHPVAGGWRVDDLGVSHFRFELDDPPLDEALLLAGGVVLGVLGEVAVGSRLGDGLGDGMPVHALEPVELVTQPLVAEARHRRALYGHAFSEPSANRRPRPVIA